VSSFHFTVQTHLLNNTSCGVLLSSPGSTLSVNGGGGAFICDLVLDRWTKIAVISRLTQPRVFYFRTAILYVVFCCIVGTSSCLLYCWHLHLFLYWNVTHFMLKSKKAGIRKNRRVIKPNLHCYWHVLYYSHLRKTCVNCVKSYKILIDVCNCCL
jgi:hypothetical protein